MLDKVANKAKNLEWFIEIMKTKMLRHSEDPLEITFKELFDWLGEEVAELKEVLEIREREEVMGGDIEKANQEVIKECADVANLAYFIADKIKRGK